MGKSGQTHIYFVAIDHEERDLLEDFQIRSALEDGGHNFAVVTRLDIQVDDCLFMVGYLGIIFANVSRM